MIRGLWDRETVALMLLAAAFPLAATWALAEGWSAVARLVYALLVSGVWHLVFMLARAHPPSFAGALTALAIAMLAPEGLGALQMAFGISFGVVMAELVFGGWGRNVLHPATVTLAFLGFSYPGAQWPELAVQVGWAAIPMALVGGLAGVMSLRLLAGAALVLGIATALGLAPATGQSATAVVLMLLVADPVASATTPLARWLNGALFGGLVAMFAAFWQDAAPVQIAVAAALLTSLAAPLLDEIAVAIWLARRRRRFG